MIILPFNYTGSFHHQANHDRYIYEFQCYIFSQGEISLAAKKDNMHGNIIRLNYCLTVSSVLCSAYMVNCSVPNQPALLDCLSPVFEVSDIWPMSALLCGSGMFTSLKMSLIYNLMRVYTDRNIFQNCFLKLFKCRQITERKAC